MNTLAAFVIVFAVVIVIAIGIDRLATLRANRLSHKAEKAKDCGECVL